MSSYQLTNAVATYKSPFGDATEPLGAHWPLTSQPRDLEAHLLPVQIPVQHLRRSFACRCSTSLPRNASLPSAVCLASAVSPQHSPRPAVSRLALARASPRLMLLGLLSTPQVLNCDTWTATGRWHHVGLSSFPHGDLSAISFCWLLLRHHPTARWLLTAVCLHHVTIYSVVLPRLTPGTARPVTKGSRSRARENPLIPSELLHRVVTEAAETCVETVMLPLNFHNAHWCCIVVKVLAKRIIYYDPLKQTPYIQTAKAVVVFLKHGGLKDYHVVHQNNPIQFDQFSCSVFVCWMILRQVVHGLTHDMTDNSLTQRRFELFYYLMTGILIAPISRASSDGYAQTQLSSGNGVVLAPANADTSIHDTEENETLQTQQDT